MSTSSAAANRALYISIGLGAAIITGALSYIYYKYLKRDVMPLKWRRVGTLQKINLFPIRSCAPLELNPEEELLCDVSGLSYRGIRDRVLMLVTGINEMITARVYSRLVLIHTRVIGESKLIITAEGMEQLELDFSTLADEVPSQDVHTEWYNLDAMFCGEKYDKWFSRFILNKENGLRLVYHPYPKPLRSINARSADPTLLLQEEGDFTDAPSYMLMNLSSVEDLNTHLDVDPLQFSSNFHLKMDVGEAYAEYNWQWVRIGEEAVFRIVAPCSIFPILRTAERDPDGLLSILPKIYRLIDDKVGPTLSIHLGIRQPGAIKANDVIYIEDNCPK